MQQYASRFNAVEINSSFYRDHKVTTYQAWRDSVPENFCFSVKLSREITHMQRLQRGEKRLRETLVPILYLNQKMGCLLVQTPPSLHYNRGHAHDFLEELRDSYQGPVAMETRHITWCKPEVDELFRQFLVSRVIADPDPYKKAYELMACGEEFNNTVYYRLHGSPEVYKSNYEPERLLYYAQEIQSHVGEGRKVWCVFDNTTYGFAMENAALLKSSLEMRSGELSI